MDDTRGLSLHRFPPALAIACLASVLLTAPAHAQFFVEFADETGQRLSVPESLGADDIEEKDYAWGDVDQDGDIDLVVVRKTPFTSAGKRENVLLINEDGVLTDRTAEFASATNVSGDEGFLTPTNDRDVALVDVDLDGWLDIVTAPTISPNDPKHIGHPRVYVNLGCSIPCDGTDDWQGFRFENQRIPAMLSDDGQAGFNPCFCSVSAGDVTGDGYPDLWFSDYDTGCGDPGSDFNNKLLINRGPAAPGHFIDVTESSFSQPFQVSEFGASGAIEDINGDGVADIVKQFASLVDIAFNDPNDEGFFDQFNSPYTASAYFVNVGNLNNDGLPDLVVSDDGVDRYLLNEGSTNGVSQFLEFVFSFAHVGAGGPAADDGFSGNSIIADLNNDGWNDVVMTDVDVDIPGCGRRTHIFQNSGGNPGGSITLQETTTGTGCQNFLGNPPTCVVAGISAEKLEGTHDVAVFDIDGDGWKDMVVGRCSGTEVYRSYGPFGVNGAGKTADLRIGREMVGGIVPKLTMTWDPSCNLDDLEYAIYQGTIGDFAGHTPLTCLTAGDYTDVVHWPSEANEYYLIVPQQDAVEGSHGFDSKGDFRTQGPSPCKPQFMGTCE